MGFCSAKCVSTARMDGRTVVITGCNTGIGKMTVQDLYKRGARVVMACRNLEKANAAREEIKNECKGQLNLGVIETIELDLSSLKSVRSCASKLLEQEEKINVLINNAGVTCPYEKTEDGFEMQFATNHLGPFLFTLLLMPKIITSTPARIVTVASRLHERGVINFYDLNWEMRSYSSLQAYCQTKLANILFNRELTRKLEEHNIKGVTTYSLHPGAIKTDLGRHLDDTYFRGASFVYNLFTPLLKTPEQGAQTTIHCAVSEEAGKETGLYYAECAPTKCSSSARNDEYAARLWEQSLKLVGIDKNYNIFV